MLVGADNAPVEVLPNPDPQISLPVHQIMLVVNGIHQLENLKPATGSPRSARARVRVRDAAAEAEGSDRLDSRADRDPLSRPAIAGARPSRRRPAPL